MDKKPNFFQDLTDFHLKFGLKYSGPPRRLPAELDAFRTKFMAEELAEYVTDDKDSHTVFARYLEVLAEIEHQTLEKKLDALVDLVYVAIGTAYLHGFDFDEAWRRVHAANMAKVRALRSEDSVRGSVYDVVKPPGWMPPILSDLVQPGHVFIKPEQDEAFAP